MGSSDIPCLNLAIDRLRATGANHFAIHVIHAPYRAGYVLHDGLWSESLSQVWTSWQEMFAVRSVPTVPFVSEAGLPPSKPPVMETGTAPSGQAVPYSVRLMQTLGINLWQWLFTGPIQTCLSQSQGIAMGQNKPLRLRLDIRDPDLIAVPWEIMQSQAGKPAISLGQQVLFSRTTSDVEDLPLLRTEQMLNVLLVLGQDSAPNLDLNPGSAFSDVTQQHLEPDDRLKLDQEAEALSRVLRNSSRFGNAALCNVDVLVQPSPAELIARLETQQYNVLFYAGHGIPAPDGGLLFLRSDMAMNGTELAQVLRRGRVKLAVFNACWGAQPDHQGGQTIPRSSLAEVLLHHGVPAVLAMRDSITDQEALAFIQAFSQALAERLSIDQAMAVARQNLLTLFKFNQQAWTLPVLYMHPEFDGELIKPLDESLTQIPSNPSQFGRKMPIASLRSLITSRMWTIRGGLMRVGISEDNDLVLRGEPGVSRKHAEIFCRNAFNGDEALTYHLRDFSRYGTWVLGSQGWQKINHQEVQLYPGTQLKFGGSQNSVLEFVVTDPEGAEWTY
ncbi:CHAT domain-containing protein [Alkalinema sp. FACHB-956]|uniref:CHAT domain-containing protein n=1 Tax=Alkalinema sp. FACHB-956 TaxID=2692768 RepID=UPI001687A623|nr:CHAT domain-containing protein [Alkalinema sp. FACHB-956]MBD2326914.1 CHAT domain-containing protein [Alkalinema sp. FACHB-956]